MKDSNRKGAGRPRIDPRMVKIPVAYRLPRWLVEWMRAQPEPQSELIEKALCKTYKLKKPTARKP